MQGTNLLIGGLAALAAALIGAGWQIASRLGVTASMGPVDLAVLRYALPGLFMAPLLRDGGLFPAGLPARWLAWMVLGGGLPFGLLVVAGAQFAPASHIGIFMAGMVPVCSAGLARLVEGEPWGARRAVGLACVVLGVMWLGGASLAHAETGAWRGHLLFVAAAVLWSTYTWAYRRSGLTPWHGTALVNAWSALLLLPVLLLVGGVPRLLAAPLPELALQAGMQGVVAGVLGLVTYLAAVKRLGAPRAALSAGLVPVLTTAGAAWLLGEAVDAATGAAAVTVAGGVLLAAWPGRQSLSNK